MAAPSPLSVRITIGILAILGFLGIVWLSMTITRWATTPGTPTPIATPTSQPQPSTGTSTHTPTVATDDGESYPYPTGPSLDGECTLPEGEFTMNPAMPESKWAIRDNLWFIEHPTLGPQKTTDGVRHCFQHSTAGMIYAAANHVLQEQISVDFSNPNTTKRIFSDSFRKENRIIKFNMKRKLTDVIQRLQPIAFNIKSTNEKEGTVTLYMNGETAGYIVNHMVDYKMKWENSDWRVDEYSESDTIPAIPITSVSF